MQINLKLIKYASYVSLIFALWRISFLSATTCVEYSNIIGPRMVVCFCSKIWLDTPQLDVVWLVFASTCMSFCFVWFFFSLCLYDWNYIIYSHDSWRSHNQFSLIVTSKKLKKKWKKTSAGACVLNWIPYLMIGLQQLVEFRILALRSLDSIARSNRCTMKQIAA